MADEFQLILQGIGDTISGFLLLPGRVLLSELVLHAPGLANLIGIDGEAGNRSQLVVTSFILWVLFAVVVWLVVRLWQNLARISGAIVRTFLFRATQAIGSLKTALVCKIRQYLPQQKSSADVPTPMVEIDDLDLAVLRSASGAWTGLHALGT